MSDSFAPDSLSKSETKQSLNSVTLDSMYPPGQWNSGTETFWHMCIPNIQFVAFFKFLYTTLSEPSRSFGELAMAQLVQARPARAAPVKEEDRDDRDVVAEMQQVATSGNKLQVNCGQDHF